MRSALLLVLASALVAGCGDEPVRQATEEVEGPSGFPVRLLALNAGGGTLPDLNDSLRDLGGWWVLDAARDGLVAARDHEAVSTTEDGLVLAGPDRVLVRFVAPPVGEELTVMARLGVGEVDIHGPSSNLHFVHVQDLAEGETLEGLVASGVARSLGGAETALAELLAFRVQKALAEPAARWVAPPDGLGHAKAQFSVPASDVASVGALALHAGEAGLEVSKVILGNRPALDRLADVQGGLSQSLAETTEPTVAPVRASGETRLALLVPPGAVEAREVEVPAGAARLSFGACVSPVAAAGAQARWRVSLDRSGGELELGSGSVRHDPEAPIRYADVHLDWPADVSGVVTLRFAVEGAAPVAFGAPMLRSSTRSKRPNVLLVSLDTLRADHVGAYGYERDTTPHLDRFAEQATLFENMSSVGPYTLPTHATMLTGQLPLRHRAIDPGSDRVDGHDLPFLPRLLAEAGYVTAGFTGGGFVTPDYGFATGFDRFLTVDPVINHESTDAESRYKADKPRHIEAIERGAAVEGVVDWIGEHAAENWFVFLHTYAPHKYDAPPELIDEFDTEPGSDWGTELRQLRVHLKPTVWPDNPPTPADSEHLVNLYDASVAFTDARVGAVLDDLDEAGLLDDAVVIVTSDHGEEFYEHQGLRHSISLYQEMLAVPLMIRTPERVGRRVREPVSLPDLTPTILDLVGLEADGVFDGRALGELVRTGRASGLSPALMVGHVGTALSRRESLRVGPLKVIHGETSDRVRFPAPAEWQLFDLSRDPLERHDLSAERPDDLVNLQTSLQSLLEALAGAAGASGEDAEVSQAVMEQLKEMGYF